MGRFGGKLEFKISMVMLQKHLWGLPREVEAEIIELAKKLGVPATDEAIANFIAAYMVCKHMINAEGADRVIASSKAGRLNWQRKLKQLGRCGNP